MPNMAELISKIARKISEEKDGEIWLTKLDFDYAYGQIKLDDETQNQCIFTITGGEFAGYYRFLKGFYGLADIPTIFQERIDKTLEFKHPAWLDDIIIVTKGTIEKHEAEVKETMRKLENAGYKSHPKKCEFFKQEAEWIGHRIDQNGIRPLQDKLKAITKIDIPKKTKKNNIFPGSYSISIEIHRKFISTNRYPQKIVKKKQNEWKWTQEHREAFNNLKKTNNTITMSGTLQRRQWKYSNNKSQHKRIGSNAVAKTTRRKLKTNQVCQQIFIGYWEKVRDKRTGAVSSSMGTGTFSSIRIRKANRITYRSPSTGAINH